MKKFVNDPTQFVPEMLEGIALANPDTLTYVPEYNLIMRSDSPREDKVEILTINDDVAVKDSTWTIGRRGVAGNFFVIKAVGAASEQGAELDELLRIGRKVNDVTRTMGVGHTACTPPA